jgi:hypothetical protein
MSERKYEKYFIMKRPMPPPGADRPPSDLDKLETPKLHHFLGLSNRIVEGAIMVNFSWMYAGEDPGRMEAHAHPYPEVIGFIGNIPEDPDDLGAEAEIWMDDEQYIITRSFMVYVPKGLKHCPLVVRNIRRPVLHFDMQLTTGDLRMVPTRRD